jgi:hypothetical protein
MSADRPRRAGEIPDSEPRLINLLFFIGPPCALYFVVLGLLGTDVEDFPGGTLVGIAIGLGVGAIWGALARLWVAARRRMRSSRADH